MAISVKKAALVLVLLACMQSPHAGGGEDELGERLVNDFLTKVITMSGNFEQSLIDARGNVVERNTGRLEIVRPSKFRWTYSEPYEQWLIADGVNIWSYDVDLEQVTVKPQAKALANTPALLLGGSEDALQQFDFGETYIESTATWVRLIPKDRSSGFDRVELGFVDEQITRMVFFDNLQQTTLVALSDVQVNEPIDAERFQFVIPDGVDVVGTPAQQEVTVGELPKPVPTAADP